MKAEGSDDRQGDVHRGAGGGDQHHAAARVAQRPEIDRHRLGVAEQEGRAREQQQRGQDDGAERVDMAERVEADAPLPRRRFVAEEAGDVSVRGLVEGDGDQNRQQPDRNEVRQVHKVGRARNTG